MLTLPSRGAYICHRCQHRLGFLRKTPSQFQNISPLAVPASQIRPISYRGHRPDFIVKKKLQDKIVDVSPETKLFGYHEGSQLIQTLEELKTAIALGDPAKVLILRESIFRLYDANKPDELAPLEPEHINILDRLADERGLVGTKEVTDNINQFRPEEGQVSTQEDISALVLKLQEAFTSSQLQRYIDDFPDRRESESPEVWSSTDETAALRRITPWRPGISDNENEFDNDPARGYVFVSHTFKQRIIIRLLRECWLLELPELNDGIGQFEIQVRKQDLAILLSPAGKLGKLSRVYLAEDDEKLEVFRKRNAIRFTTRSLNKEMIVQYIDNTLRGIQTATLDLRDMVPKQKGKPMPPDHRPSLIFDDRTLQLAAELTTTQITRTQKEKHKIMISFVNKPGSSTSRVDIVRRTLWGSTRKSERTDHRLISTGSSKAASFLEYVSTETLPWQYRARQWFRWMAPIPKHDLAPSQNAPPQNTHPPNKPSPIDTIPSVSTSTPPSKSPLLPLKAKAEAVVKEDTKTSWTTEYRTKTTALMGAVLHSPLYAGANSTNLMKDPALRSDLFHTFCTRVPHISRFVIGADEHVVRHRICDFLVLRFRPNPFFLAPMKRAPPGKKMKSHEILKPVGWRVVNHYPEIEMRFEIDRENQRWGDSVLKRVDAILFESTVDSMNPEGSVDIRFQQRFVSRLKDLDAKWLQKWIQESQLYVGPPELRPSLGPLHMKPTLTVPIERHLMDRSLGGNMSKETTDVEYLYVGMEIQKKVYFKHGKWKMEYTSVEGARAGGKRGELRLHPTKAGEVATEQEFVQKAYEVADILGSAKAQIWKVKSDVNQEPGGRGLFRHWRNWKKEVEKHLPAPLRGEEEEEAKKALRREVREVREAMKLEELEQDEEEEEERESEGGRG